MIREKAKLATAFVVALLIAVVAWTPAEARRNRQRFESGSILVEITAGSPQALVGLAVTLNGGIEKTISYPLPKLTSADMKVTVPLFVMIVDIDDDGLEPTIKDLDTLLILTNTNASGGSDVTVKVTFRQADGTPAVAATAAAGNPATFTIAPTHTIDVSAIVQLNP